jgi:hypothetical protein
MHLRGSNRAGPECVRIASEVLPASPHFGSSSRAVRTHLVTVPGRPGPLSGLASEFRTIRLKIRPRENDCGQTVAMSVQQEAVPTFPVKEPFCILVFVDNTDDYHETAQSWPPGAHLECVLHHLSSLTRLMGSWGQL